MYDISTPDSRYFSIYNGVVWTPHSLYHCDYSLSFLQCTQTRTGSPKTHTWLVECNQQEGYML